MAVEARMSQRVQVRPRHVPRIDWEVLAAVVIAVVALSLSHSMATGIQRGLFYGVAFMAIWAAAILRHVNKARCRGSR